MESAQGATSISSKDKPSIKKAKSKASNSTADKEKKSSHASGKTGATSGVNEKKAGAAADGDKSSISKTAHRDAAFSVGEGAARNITS